MPFHNGAITAPLQHAAGITRHLDSTTWHQTALDGAWYHCWGAVAGALVLVRWCDGVGAVAKW